MKENNIIPSDNLFPSDAHSFEVFAIKGNEAYIGFKLKTGCFHFVTVPYTEPKEYQCNQSQSV